MEGLMVNPSGHQLPAHNEGNSMMDRFLNYCDLPILGATALDQYLTNQPISSVHNQGMVPVSTSTPPPHHQISSSSQHHISSSHPHNMSAVAMSPDSSNWTPSSSSSCSSGVSSGSDESAPESLDGQNELDNLPDSTTRPVSHNGVGIPVDLLCNGGLIGGNSHLDDDQMSVNSDPINSSGSEYSFAASPPMFESLEPVTPNQHQQQSNNIIDDLLSSEPNNNISSLTNKRPAPASSPQTVEEPSATVAKRKKKSKVGPTDLKCAQCEYTTRVKEHLTSHMNCHASERKFRCNMCGQSFKWSHSLRRHQRTHQKDYKYKCSTCPKSFLRKDHLAVHEKLHDDTSSETFPCSECGATFKNKKTLTGHLKTHTADKPFKCAYCESEFTRRASLTRHVLATHAGQVFHCDICTAPFSYKSAMEDHRRAVHNEGKRDFHCLACGLSFACKAYLQKHTTVCKNRPNRETVGCDECGDRFNSRKSLQEHRRTKHNRMAVAAKQNIGHTVGQYFDKYSQQQAAVINHSQYSHQLPPLPSFSPAMTVYPGVVSTQSTFMSMSNRTISGYNHSKFSASRSSLPPYSSAVDNGSMLPPAVEQSQLVENNYIVHQDPMMAIHSPAISHHPAANNQSLHSLQSHHNQHHQSPTSSPFQPLPPRVTISEFYDNSAIVMDHENNSGENFGSILRQVYDSEATAASDFHARAAVAASAAASGHIMTANDPYLVPHHMNMQLYDLI